MPRKLLALKVGFIGALLVLTGFILLVVSIIISEINSEIAGIIRDLGITMTPIGFLVLIYEYFLRKEFLEMIKKEILEYKKGVYRDRGAIDFLKLFEDASDEVCILDTSLEYFYGIPGFLETIEERLEKGCNFHFLALNPKSPIAQYRAEDIGEAKFVDGIEISISKFSNFKSRMEKKNYKGKIEIRKYDCIPNFVLIIADDKLIMMGSLLQKRRGRDSMHIEITKSTEEDIYQQFYEHFYYIWNGEKTKSISEGE